MPPAVPYAPDWQLPCRPATVDDAHSPWLFQRVARRTSDTDCRTRAGWPTPQAHDITVRTTLLSCCTPYVYSMYMCARAHNFGVTKYSPLSLTMTKSGKSNDRRGKRRVNITSTRQSSGRSPTLDERRFLTCVVRCNWNTAYRHARRLDDTCSA